MLRITSDITTERMTHVFHIDCRVKTSAMLCFLLLSKSQVKQVHCYPAWRSCKMQTLRSSPFMELFSVLNIECCSISW